METHANPAGAGDEPAAMEVCFATPLFMRQLDDAAAANARLQALFLSREREERMADSPYSNVGGWHSAIDLQESWDADVRWVLERCRDLAHEATARLLGSGHAGRRLRFSLAAWANVSREGDYNVPHVHEATWAAVYYAAVPAQCLETGSGALELMDPRALSAVPDLPCDFFATRRVIRPRPGLLALFPGPLMHYVHPFRGPGERISIACDIGLQRWG